MKMQEACRNGKLFHLFGGASPVETRRVSGNGNRWKILKANKR